MESGDGINVTVLSHISHIDVKGSDSTTHHAVIPDLLRIFLLIYLPLVFTLGTVGNFLVIWIFCR